MGGRQRENVLKHIKGETTDEKRGERQTDKGEAGMGSAEGDRKLASLDRGRRRVKGVPANEPGSSSLIITWASTTIRKRWMLRGGRRIIGAEDRGGWVGARKARR